jgi:hypothetical protein
MKMLLTKKLQKMKLSNIFKKEVKTTSAKVEKLEKKQLENIIGGDDTVIVTETDAEQKRRVGQVKYGNISL